MVDIFVEQDCALAFAGPVIDPGTPCFDNIDRGIQPVQILKHRAKCIRTQSEPGCSLAIEETPEFKAFVTNPTLSVKDRKAGLPHLYTRAEGTGAKKEALSDITKNLFSLLSENGRLVETAGVIEGFNELVAKRKGELNVTVTSATPLTRDILSRLEAILKESQTAQQAKSLKLINKVRYDGL